MIRKTCLSKKSKEVIMTQAVEGITEMTMIEVIEVRVEEVLEVIMRVIEVTMKEEGQEMMITMIEEAIGVEGRKRETPGGEGRMIGAGGSHLNLSGGLLEHQGQS